MPTPPIVDDARGAAGMRRAEAALRLVPLGMSLAAMSVMLRNSQSDEELGSVDYSDLGAFRYIVYANAACAAYSLLSSAALLAAGVAASGWAVYVLDQVATYVVLAAGAVAAEVLYLAYEGDDEVTWSEECGVFGWFCRRAAASVGITFASVVCYALLSLVSAYRLFSAFDPPAAPAAVLLPAGKSDGGGVEIVSFAV